MEETYLDAFKPVAVKPGEVRPGESGEPPKELSDYEIGQIHAGLLIPNGKAILSMSREIRKWRGHTDPDAI